MNPAFALAWTALIVTFVAGIFAMVADESRHEELLQRLAWVAFGLGVTLGIAAAWIGVLLR